MTSVGEDNADHDDHEDAADAANIQPPGGHLQPGAGKHAAEDTSGPSEDDGCGARHAAASDKPVSPTAGVGRHRRPD